MNYRSTILCLTALAAFNLSTLAADYSFTEAGFRAGTDLEKEISLTSYEVFGTLSTPWDWELSDNIHLVLSVEIVVGALTGEGETAGYARIAPTLELTFGDFPVSAVLSSGPSVYSEDTFDRFDFGNNFLFTTGFGFDWQVNEDWTVGYRIQHSSNARLFVNQNPGIDMHTMSVGYSY
jgi:lipid A 3-O-deacylase